MRLYSKQVWSSSFWLLAFCTMTSMLSQQDALAASFSGNPAAERIMSNRCIDADYIHGSPGNYFSGLKNAELNEYKELTKDDVRRIIEHKKLTRGRDESRSPNSYDCFETRGSRFLYSQLFEPTLRELLEKRAEVRWLLCHAPLALSIAAEAHTAASILEILRNVALEKIDKSALVAAYTANRHGVAFLLGEEILKTRFSIAVAKSTVEHDAIGDACDHQDREMAKAQTNDAPGAMLELVRTSYAAAIRKYANECYRPYSPMSTDEYVIKEFNDNCRDEAGSITQQEQWNSRQNDIIEARKNQLQRARFYIQSSYDQTAPDFYKPGGIVDGCYGPQVTGLRMGFGSVVITCNGRIYREVYFDQEGKQVSRSGMLYPAAVSIMFRRTVEGFVSTVNESDVGYSACIKATQEPQYSHSKVFQRVVSNMGKNYTVYCRASRSLLKFSRRFTITEDGGLLAAR